jgi:hypothetical protein
VLQSPSLADVLLAAVEAKLALVFTAAPGRVLVYNKDEQSVDVQPIVQSAYLTEEGARVAETQPVLTRVPAIVLGGGGFRTTYPIEKGDTCLIIHLHCSGDRWFARGGDVVDPGDDRRHHISDAVALVGLRDFKHALANAPTDRMSMGADDGKSVEVFKDKVKLGSNDANDKVARKSDLEALKDGFDARKLVLQAEIDAAAAVGDTATVTTKTTEKTTVQAFIDALPIGWPECSPTVFSE